MEKQDIDNMSSWNGVSLFDTEESTPESEGTSTTTKDMGVTIE